jgi:hypothetical protein
VPKNTTTATKNVAPDRMLIALRAIENVVSEKVTHFVEWWKQTVAAQVWSRIEHLRKPFLCLLGFKMQ